MKITKIIQTYKAYLLCVINNDLKNNDIIIGALHREYSRGIKSLNNLQKLISVFSGLVPEPADKMEEAARGGDGDCQEEAGRPAGGGPGRAEQRGRRGRGGGGGGQEGQARARQPRPRPGPVRGVQYIGSKFLLTSVKTPPAEYQQTVM